MTHSILMCQCFFRIFFSYFIKRLCSPVAPRRPSPILWGAAGPIRPPTSSSRVPPACQAGERAGWGLGPAAEWDSIWSPAPAPRSAYGLTPAGRGNVAGGYFRLLGDTSCTTPPVLKEETCSGILFSVTLSRTDFSHR